MAVLTLMMQSLQLQALTPNDGETKWITQLPLHTNVGPFTFSPNENIIAINLLTGIN